MYSKAFVQQGRVAVQSAGRPKSSKRRPRGDPASPPLGCPVGLTQAFKQNAMKVNQSDAELLAIATCCYAYAQSYIQPPCLWSSQTLNDIVIGGADHLRVMLPPLEPNGGETTIICGRPFQVDSHAVQVAASEPLLIGNLMSRNRPTAGPSLRHGLRQFFRSRSAVGCLFRCEHVIVLMWRADQVYCVFDASGRNKRCQTDAVNGVASLICVARLHNVCWLLLHMSGLQSDALYSLSELRVAKLQPIGDGSARVDAPAAGVQSPNRGYEVLTEGSAILRGSLGVSNACFTATRNRQALIVCCVAYVYSLVRSPNAWTSDCVDQVLLFGNQLYTEWRSAAVAAATTSRTTAADVFGVRDIPPMISLGAFRAALCITPYAEGGRLTHSLCTRTSELQRALRQFFDEPASRQLRRRCALVQTDQLSFAVWHRSDSFYLFDGASERVTGSTGGSAACLHMFSTLEGLTAKLYEIVMCVAEKERFYVHGVSATVTDNRRPAMAAGCEDDEVSLNESLDLEVPVSAMSCLNGDGCGETNGMDGECNLDSPSLSATQFVRPWHMVKEAVFAPPEMNDKVADSKSSVISDESLDDEDDDTPANNDLANAEYNQLHLAGLSDEEIRAYLQLGFGAEEALRWSQEGVSPDQVARLKACGITDVNDFVNNYRKYDLNIEDCERLTERQIPVKMFARMKAAGSEPDAMTLITASDDDKKRFRESGLNECKMEKLMAAGVTVEQFELATREGLTYEEMLHATKHGIQLEEFARLKDEGMSSVDIVRAQEMAIDPETPMHMKQSEEMRAQEMAIDPEMLMQMKQSEEMPAQGMTIDPQMLNQPKQPEEMCAQELYNDSETLMQPKQPEEMCAKELDIEPDTLWPMKQLNQESAQEITIDANILMQTKPLDLQRALKLSLSAEEHNALRENGMVDEATVMAFAAKLQTNEELDELPATMSKELANGELEEKETDTNDEPDAETCMEEICDDCDEAKYCADWSTKCPATDNQKHLPECFDPSKVELDTTCLDENRRHEQKAPIAPKHNIAVIKSAARTPTSIRKLLNASFKLVDRVLVLDSHNQPNCVAFIDTQCSGTPEQPLYFLCEDCHDNLKSIRRLAVDDERSRLATFCSLDNMIERIIQLLQHSSLRSEMQVSVQYAQDLLNKNLAAINEQLDRLLKQFRQINGNTPAMCL